MVARESLLSAEDAGSGSDDRAAEVAAAQPAPTSLRIELYDADGRDATLSLEQIDPAAIGERHLLWIDLQGEDDALLTAIAQRLSLPPVVLDSLRSLGGRPVLENFGDWFYIQAVAVLHTGSMAFNGLVLGLVVGPNCVFTVHREAIPFLEALRERERADTELGVLSAESFAASLLDWQLATYFEAVSAFEDAVDRLEVNLLGGPVSRDVLPELLQLRRASSRLRRMLSLHRPVFNAMARPDFRPASNQDTDLNYQSLNAHFERATNAVENARDLVVGSFELFTTRTAQRTNDTMKVLTFFTVLLGTLAVVAGVLGMNFAAPFFDSGLRGFWIAIGSMAAIAMLATLVARWRDWL